MLVLNSLQARTESMYQGYRAPTPVIFPVNHPSGVCSPPFRDDAPPPTPSDSGFAEVKDSLLALAAACTDNKGCIRQISNHRTLSGPLKGFVDSHAVHETEVRRT
jgi:hypothetical protein